ncbi:MAG: sulfotransferase family 2 domain-containing protein [Alphaproteobacteria bacterium]|nr:sulfotransferase family 2 domain-containing protein [Alphaproteobacteria bacterium]
MIVSHRHKFIFVKTKKTAGTSLEIALSKFCGPDDILTPISDEDEATRKRLKYRGAQNYTTPLRQWTLRDFERFLAIRQKPEFFFNHIPASRIRAIVGESVWNAYYKFTIVRNPWDRLVSQYFYDQRHAPHGARPSVHDLLLSEPQLVQSNWPVYTDGNQVIVDAVLRYENLGEEVRALGVRLGLGDALSEAFASIRAKAGLRPVTATAAQFLSPQDIELIGLLAEREIAQFHYEPPAVRERLADRRGLGDRVLG